MENWQTSGNGAAASSSSQQQALRETRPDRIVLTLSIATADELPAAEAVIAKLYGVDDALFSLQHHQLVQALIIADIINATEAADLISRQLQTVATSENGLSEVALEALAGLSAWPECLLQLLPVIIANAKCLKESSADLAALHAADANRRMQRLLLSVFGDLQIVWRDEFLTDMLLQLPCPAMQLLLSSDDLRVPSEDIVLYTAQQYVNTQKPAAVKTAAKSALSTVIRAPHLSSTMLHYVALAHSSTKLLLGGYLTQITQLLLMKRTQQRQACRSLLEEIKNTAGAPVSWQLGGRQHTPAVPANVVWKLPVQQLKEASQKAAASQSVQILCSPRSPPCAGFACDIIIRCNLVEGDVKVGLYVEMNKVSSNFFFDVSYDVIFNGIHNKNSVSRLPGDRCYGWADFFKVGPMPGGWDEAGWAAKGLPTTGDLVLELEVLSIS